MRQEARARRRDRKEQETGFSALFIPEELVRGAPLRTNETHPRSAN
jgi:hypothetical protein